MDGRCLTSKPTIYYVPPTTCLFNICSYDLHSCVICGKSWVQVPTRTQTILTQIWMVFLSLSTHVLLILQHKIRPPSRFEVFSAGTAKNVFIRHVTARTVTSRGEFLPSSSGTKLHDVTSQKTSFRTMTVCFQILHSLSFTLIPPLTLAQTEQKLIAASVTLVPLLC
jgi:hypothetical protein